MSQRSVTWPQSHTKHPKQTSVAGGGLDGSCGSMMDASEGLPWPPTPNQTAGMKGIPLPPWQSIRPPPPEAARPQQHTNRFSNRQ